MTKGKKGKHDKDAKRSKDIKTDKVKKGKKDKKSKKKLVEDLELNEIEVDASEAVEEAVLDEGVESVEEVEIGENVEEAVAEESVEDVVADEIDANAGEDAEDAEEIDADANEDTEPVEEVEGIEDEAELAEEEPEPAEAEDAEDENSGAGAAAGADSEPEADAEPEAKALPGADSEPEAEDEPAETESDEATDEQADSEEAGLIERLLEQPYWVIDLLPSQVPENAGGQFFALEKTFLDGLRQLELRYQFVDVLQKLNCYHDFVVYRGESEKGKLNLKPQKLEKWIIRNEEGLNIVLLSANAPEDALIAVPTDSTCMTLYGPSPELLEQVKSIATASGLFVWMPPQG